MSEKENTPVKKHEGIDINRSYQKVLDYYTRHQNLIFGILIGILLLGAGIFAYIKFYQQPREIKAMNAITQAQAHFERDSLMLALEGDDNADGFLTIADRYSRTSAGNLAKYYAAVCYVKLKDNDAALTYLKKYRKNNHTFGAAAYMLMGDIYLESGDTQKALKHYKDAADKKSLAFSPVALLKSAMVFETMDKWDDAFKMYSKIERNYHDAYSKMNLGALKERAREKAGK